MFLPQCFRQTDSRCLCDLIHTYMTRTLTKFAAGQLLQYKTCIYFIVSYQSAVN